LHGALCVMFRIWHNECLPYSLHAWHSISCNMLGIPSPITYICWVVDGACSCCGMDVLCLVFWAWTVSLSKCSRPVTHPMGTIWIWAWRWMGILTAPTTYLLLCHTHSTNPRLASLFISVSCMGRTLSGCTHASVVLHVAWCTVCHVQNMAP